ncbi:hypothetical protein GQX73_g5191 [Xylaria multiplex]|uniref:Uncharacterized protein n=1 Tax=Xylaria multiplex TaxID=323545 RepID=A0A7C8IWZ2_9PEZI|nr:hypothetical protein GQX73_g5191 [Xylaria multiplex]
MASKRRQEKRFTRPPSRAGLENASDTEVESTIYSGEPALRRRQASVYDAVAGLYTILIDIDMLMSIMRHMLIPYLGRVTTTLPISSYHSQRSRVKHHKQNAADARRNTTLAPEEVLFRRSGAPVRYAEKDIYQAHEDLPDGGRGILPDSDLLKTIHSYASHFYRDLPANKLVIHSDTGEGISERSMDETALLAFGILLEEASREALGKKGDLVFTEGVTVGGHRGPQTEDEDAEAFGFLDAPRYEAREHLKIPRADRNE